MLDFFAIIFGFPKGRYLEVGPRRGPWTSSLLINTTKKQKTLTEL